MRRFTATFIIFLFAASLALAQSRYSEDTGSLLGFGGAIAVSGGDVFVGSAPTGWPTGSDPAGHVYRYSRDENGDWFEAERIKASDGELGDEFGRSILVDDELLMVGAPGIGAVYAFRKKDGKWTQTKKFSPEAALADGFEFAGAYARGGYRTQTIAAIDNNVLVTSYNADKKEGALHVFHHMGAMWNDVGTLTDAAAWAVVTAGNTLFIGIPEANDLKGGILIYELGSGDEWEQTGEIRGNNVGNRTYLGRSLAASGDRLYAGVTESDESGTVLVYERDADNNWRLVETLRHPVPENGGRTSFYGPGVALSGTDLIVGTHRAAFVYDTANLEAGYLEISAPAGQDGHGFGVGLGVEGDVMAIGSPSAFYGSGRATIYERNQDGNWNPAWIAEIDVTSFESISGDQIDCENGKVAGLFPCDNVDLISLVSTADLVQDRGANLNDIWGWEDPETGKEYVLASRTDGVSFVDISNPGYPVIVGQLMRTEGSPGAWWRDVKVYKDHAFIVADGSGNHGMQIFDLTQLRDVDPADMPVDFEETAHYDRLASSHNIIINEETGFAFAIGSRSGGEGCGGQLHMMDIKDPQNPQFVGCYVHPGSGGTHDAQCVIYRGNDAAYNGREICLNSNGSSFVIADVTDKSDPKTVAVATYPKTAYTHQGWLSEDHNYFYMNDELDEMNKIVDKTRTLIWDVSDLEDPILVKEYYHGNGASDHNLYIKGNFMYQSNYQAGLRILDISDRENPIEVGHFDTAPFADDTFGFAGSWSNYPYFRSGIIAVSSQAEGLFLVKKREVDL